MSGQKFIRVAFAASGDTTAVPDTVQGDGSVSYPEGWGPDYELNPETEVDAKRIPRRQSNAIYKDVTENIRQYQLAGFPEWATSAQNGGTPVLYPLNAYLRNFVGGQWNVYRAKIQDAQLQPGVAAGWADEWDLFVPTDAAALKATQTETNEGTGTKLAGTVELVKAAREGRWWFAGDVIYNTPTDLRVVYSGVAPFVQTDGARVAFKVPTPLAGPGNTLKVGANAAIALRTINGEELQANDLIAGQVYEATVSAGATQWRLNNVVMSVLQRYSSAGDGAIFGYVATNTPGALTTQLTLGFGNCRDTTNQRSIPRLVPMTKRLDQVWAVGNGNGGRDVAAAPAPLDTWHCHAILNDTTGVTDWLFSKSLTAPTLPAGFTFFRRVFSVTLDGAASIRQFVHVADQDYVAYKQRTTDWANTPNGVAAGTLRAIPVPKGLKLRVRFFYGSTGVGGSGSNPAFSGVYDPDVGVPVFGTATQWAQVRVSWNNSNDRYVTLTFDEFCNNNAQVYTASNDTGDVLAGGVLGYFDYRGKFG